MALRMGSIECEPGIKRKMWETHHFFCLNRYEFAETIRNVPAQSEMDKKKYIFALHFRF